MAGAAGTGGRTRGWLLPLVIAVVMGALANVPWVLMALTPRVEGFRVVLPGALTQPGISLIMNGVAVAMLIWSVVQLIGSSSPAERLARRLLRRGDVLGAAEVYVQAGAKRRALQLLKTGRAWSRAAAVALELGLEEEAADLLRRAGGRQLTEASRMYRRLGNTESERRCERELAEWCLAQGHYDEALEAWMRAGEVQRAARAARVSLNEGRLQHSHPSFKVAIRAAEEARDHRLLARLHETEGAWTSAARAWRSAGDHGRAAEYFRRAGQLDQAAQEETASGRHREAVLLKVRHLGQSVERLQRLVANGHGESTEAAQLKVQLRHETDPLLEAAAELGLETEIVSLLKGAGRVNEAVDRLATLGQVQAAADLAQEVQRWDLAAPLHERMARWTEASEAWEQAGDLERAARCAERVGEDERALELYRKVGKPKETAHCLARLGYLQDAVVELHREGLLAEACEVLRIYPGPLPDVSDVILDVAEWARANVSVHQAIACLQRAVVGLALRPNRVDPAVALARLLHQAGDSAAAVAQVERVLRFDYAYGPAQQLKREIAAEHRVGDPASTMPAPRGEGSQSELAPTTAEQRYEIQQELGRGGMGVVYRALDTRLQRDVALKVLRATSAEETARLEREARAAATLNHPGIVTVYDFRPGFGGHFIVMEYVPGEPLDQLIRSDRERVRRSLVTILIRLADAVAFAHSRHVVHRDLKPGNILLTPSLDVKILDFGIAARLDVDAPKESQVCGTPFYMSPEQIRGEVPTPASDIYSLGATAFHLATGRPPFPRGDVINAHLEQPAPDPREQAPDLHPTLARIILRCLEKEPRDRYPSAFALRDALLPLEAGGALVQDA